MADAFATAQDISARLGRALTSAEEDQIELLLEMAADAIADTADVAQALLEGLDPFPRTLWALHIELTVRAMAAPAGARSTQETLGQYSRSTSYRDPDTGGGLFLTDREQRMVRRAVFGGDMASVRVGAITDDLWVS
jgi:hypothetical protein